jgi:hypothetical protein
MHFGKAQVALSDEISLGPNLEVVAHSWSFA